MPILSAAAASAGEAPDGSPAARPRAWSAILLTLLGAMLGSSSVWGGFYKVSVWGPIAIVLIVVLVATIVSGQSRPSRPALLACGAVSVFALWSAVSSGWAESAPLATLEAHRWVLYAVVLALGVLLCRADSDRKLLLGAATVASLLVALVTVFRLLGPDAGSLFLSRRLAEPLGYVNGQAAALILTFWPLLAVAERSRSALLRGTSAGGGCLVLGLALLTQSRGAALAFMLAAGFLMVAFPGRHRRGWLLVIVALGLAGAAPSLLDVYTSASTQAARPTSGSIHHATLLLALSSTACGVAWAVATYLGERVTERGVRSRELGRRASLVALIVIVGGSSLALVAFGDATDRAQRQLDQFTQLDSDRTDTARFFAGGGNRWDYWRVAWHEFESEPLRGLGAGNYTRDYFTLRRSTENVRQPHSLQLQTLAELGIVGALLLACVLGAIGAALISSARRVQRGESSTGIGIAASGILVCWLVHTSVDWLHLIPGVSGLAMCALAAILPTRASPSSSRYAIALPMVAIIASAFAAAGIGRLTIADGYKREARAHIADDPLAAVRWSNRSLRLIPNDVEAFYAKAAAIARQQDYAGARGTLLRAARAEPSNFLPRALLGDLALRRGDNETAAREYRTAARLNPRDVSLRAAAQRARRR